MENPVLEDSVILNTTNSVETERPLPEVSTSSHVEDSCLIARARAVGVVYESAQPGVVETEEDRRKRQQRNQRRVTEEE